MPVILTGDCLGYLARETRRSRRCDFAVAFWGRGAGRSLGLLDVAGARVAGAAVRVICNLRTGATDPDEVRAIMAAGLSVKHSDTLHAKVYRFDGTAVVGSANASANGLGSEGEAAYWSEVGVVVKAAGDLAALDAWFEKAWAAAHDVGNKDLEAAADARARRGAGDRRSKRGGTDMESAIDALRSRPEAAAGREVYLICNTTFYGEPIRRHLREVEEQTGVLPEVYADWRPPLDAILIDFSWRKGRRGIEFNGLFRTSKRRKATDYNGSKLYEVQPIESVPPDESAIPLSNDAIMAELERWRELLSALKAGLRDRWEADGCCIRLDDVAAFLGERRRHVLNVLDKLGHYREDDAGMGLSGYWRRPDVRPDTIRVYREAGGRSVAGGVIVERRKRDDGTTVVVFKPDADEGDRPWPSLGFRANGCVATER